MKYTWKCDWKYASRLTRCVEIAWLPSLLTVLLVIQTHLFNVWLGITPGLYFWRSASASVSLGMLLFFPSIFFSKRNMRYLYLSVISFAVFLIFISQFMYYQYSGGFLQATSLAYAKQAADLLGTIKTLLTYKLILFLLPLIFIVVGYFKLKTHTTLDTNGANKISNTDLNLSIKEKGVAIVMMLFVFCLGYGILFHTEELDDGDLGRLYDNTEMYNLSALVGKAGIVNFYLESLVEYATKPDIASDSDKAFLATWAENRDKSKNNATKQGKNASSNKGKSADFGIYKGKNLIFIQMESLENWVIGYKIDGIEIAPNLTELAGQGTYFTNYYSQIGVGNTADAEFSTLNSLYPLPDTVAFITHAKNQYAALPNLLDQHGYDTSSLHGDVATFWNRSNAYPSLGYENQVSQPDYTIPRPIGFENLGDSDFFQQSIPKLEAMPKPFMATLITLSTHTPFALPEDLQTLSIPKDSTLTATQKQYVQAVHYSDEALGEFIAGLKADKLYNNSVIFIFGDHTAFIGTEDSQIEHVPLIILTPTLPAQINTEPASHLDLYPTAADLLGITYPDTVLGQDLFNTKTPVVVQRVAGTGAIKFIESSNLKYTGSADGIFEHGSCVLLSTSTSPTLSSFLDAAASSTLAPTSTPIGIPTSVGDCQALYDEEASTTKASDIVVRYNLLPLLSSDLNTSLGASVRAKK